MTNLASMISELGDKFSTTTDDLATRLGELEKRAAREREAANDNYIPCDDSPVRQLVESEAFRALNGGRARGRAAIEVAAITSANTTVGAGRSAATSLVPAHRVAGIVTPAQRALTIRDLIASGQTTSASIEFVQETGFTNNAAPVAEGAQKPYSDLTFNLKTSPVRTIAHLFKLSKQMLDDAVGLVSYLDLRGSTGLKNKEEQQLLFGDGTGQNIHGLMPQSTPFDNALRKAGDTPIDIIRHAILQTRRAEYRASGLILHPDDVEALELTKDSEGRYIFVTSIPDGGAERIWRLPIVDTTAMPAGSFMVGAFDAAAQIFDRQQVVFELSTENADDFEKNMATARVEERLALAVYRPEALISGQFEAP